MSLHVDIHGEGETPLVLLHGWGFNGAVWKSFLPYLAKRYTCYAVDLPGYGNSSHIKAENLPEISRLVLDAVPDTANWLGWSMGGLVAIQAAIDAPHRISMLNLVSSNPRFIAEKGDRYGIRPAVFEEFSNSLKQDIKTTLRRFLLLQASGLANARQVALGLQAALLERPLPSIGVLQAGLNILCKTDFWPVVAELQVPVKVLLGDRDTLVPEQSLEKWQRCCPKIPVSRIQGAGHAPFVSHPAILVNQLARDKHV